MAFDPLGTLGLRLAQDPEARQQGIAREQASSVLSSLFGITQGLEEANASDTAPTIEAAQVRSPVNFLTALGSAIQDPFRPGTVQALAQRQAAVDRANAQLQQQAEMANQVQEGYLERRRQQRQQEIARLKASGEEVRAKLNARLQEIGLVADQEEQARREAARTAASAVRKDIDKAEADWLKSFGAMVFGDLAQLELGQEIINGQPSGQAINPRMAEVMKNNLATAIRSLPDGSDMKQSLLERLGAIENRDEPPPPPDDEDKGGPKTSDYWSRDRGISFLPTDEEFGDWLAVGAPIVSNPGGTGQRVERLRDETPEKFRQAITAPEFQAAEAISDLGLVINDFLTGTDVPTSGPPVATSLLDSLRERATSQLLSNIGGKTKGRR